MISRWVPRHARVLLTLFSLVSGMSEAKGRNTAGAAAGPQTPSEQARARVTSWISAYAGQHPELQRGSEAALLQLVRSRDPGWSERAVAIGLLLRRPVPPPGWEALLLSIVRDEQDSPYLRMDAALALALLGRREQDAVLILRRVITPRSFFAISQSEMERGAACLGLALLGDRGSRPLITALTHVGFNGIGRDAALALSVLDGAP